MAVEIDIDGNRVTLNDVATEETLKRLLDVMERQGGNSSGFDVNREAAQVINNTTKENKKLKVELQGLTKSADDLAEELDDAADSAGGFGSKLMGFAEKISDAAADVIKFAGNTAGAGLNMKQVGGFAEQLGSSFKIGGAALGAGAGVVIGHTANLADSFDQLTRTGAAFSGNMFDIERAAARSYLSLEQFGGIIRENSASLAVFGGTSKLGVQRFVELNQRLQQTSREQLSYLGISAEESAELLGEYMAMQQRNTHFQGMSVRQQTQAAVQFSEEITKLAALTGQDRKALAEKMAREKQAADIEMKLSQMTNGASTKTRATIELLRNKFGEVPGFLDLMTQGMRGLSVGATEQGNQLLLSPLGPAVNDIGKMLRTGEGDIGGAIEKLRGRFQEHQQQFGNLGDLSGVSGFAEQMSQAEYAMQGFDRTIKVLDTEFEGDVKKFLNSLKPNPDEVTKNVKDSEILIQKAGETVRLGINTFTENAVEPLAGALSKLKTKLDNFDISDPDTLKKMGLFKDATVASTGATSGLAVAARKAAEYLLKLSPGAGAVDDVAKAGATIASTTSAGTKVAAAGTGILAKFLGKLPAVGALITGGITAAETGSVVEGAGAGFGSLGGGLLGAGKGAALGTAILPGVGTAIGAVLGGLIGSFGGEAIGQGIASGGERFGTLGKIFDWAKGFEYGGVVRQPTLSMIGEGSQDEAVVPLPNNRNIPVDIDLSAIDNLTKSVEKLVQLQGMNTGNSEVVDELRKLNRQTGKVITLQS
jgi:hypothetical protein